MSYLICPEDEAAAIQGLDDLWDTMGDFITIVKEAPVSISSITGTFIPGFGSDGNQANFTPVPESRTFQSMSVEKHEDKVTDIISTKQNPKQTLYLKVKQDARDYILDGRKVIHVIHKGRTYNLVSDDETADMLSRTYYVFKLELTR